MTTGTGTTGRVLREQARRGHRKPGPPRRPGPGSRCTPRRRPATATRSWTPWPGAGSSCWSPGCTRTPPASLPRSPRSPTRRRRAGGVHGPDVSGAAALAPRLGVRGDRSRRARAALAGRGAVAGGRSGHAVRRDAGGRARTSQGVAKALARSGGPRAGQLLTRPGGPLRRAAWRAVWLSAPTRRAQRSRLERPGCRLRGIRDGPPGSVIPGGCWTAPLTAETLETLLSTQLVGRTYESVLRNRHTLARRLDRTPTVAEWSAALADALARRRSARRRRRRPMRRCGWPSRPRTGSVRTALSAPANGWTPWPPSTTGGRSTSYGSRWAPVSAIRARPNRPCCGSAPWPGRRYGSWAEFSLGYSLTRVLHFGPGDPSGEVEQSLAQHRVLTQDPDSPYRKIAWS